MVAYALDFNKDKMQRLDARVKHAKLYKEIKIKSIGGYTKSHIESLIKFLFYFQWK